MTQTRGLRPLPEPWLTDDAPPPPLPPPADDRNALERFTDFLLGLLDGVPDAWWPYLFGGLLLAVVITWPWAKRQAFIAGQLSTGKGRSDKKSDALLVAAMIPAVLFWLAVLAGSFKGLIAFARDDLNWHDGTELLVPLTLDGVSIAFGFLAFRAIKANRSPDRCNAMVKGASLASALINFVHEVNLPEGTWLGGFYLALLSVLGVVMFHEFLDQFGEGTGTVRRAKPHFGLRWATMPPNTVCAWLAWQNYPPTPLRANATEDEIIYWGSVNHAIDHLEEVRALKRQTQRDNDLRRAERGEQWWHPVVPWVRIRQLNALRAEQAEHLRVALAEQAERFLAEHRSEAEQTRTEQAEQLRAALAEQAERLEAEHRSRAEQFEAEQAERQRAALAEQAERLEAEHRSRAEQCEAEQAERQRAALAEQAERLEAERAEHAEQLRTALTEQAERLAAEHAEQLRTVLAERRGGRPRRSGQPEHAEQADAEQPDAEQPAVVMPFRDRRRDKMEAADRRDLAKMFTEHPGSRYEWGPREINRLTGAGFSTRAPRLLERAEDHIRRCGKTGHDGCFAQPADEPAGGPHDVSDRAGELATVGA